jgi:hypothetical protein
MSTPTGGPINPIDPFAQTAHETHERAGAEQHAAESDSERIRSAYAPKKPRTPPAQRGDVAIREDLAPLVAPRRPDRPRERSEHYAVCADESKPFSHDPDLDSSPHPLVRRISTTSNLRARAAMPIFLTFGGLKQPFAGFSARRRPCASLAPRSYRPCPGLLAPISAVVAATRARTFGYRARWSPNAWRRRLRGRAASGYAFRSFSWSRASWRRLPAITFGRAIGVRPRSPRADRKWPRSPRKATRRPRPSGSRSFRAQRLKTASLPSRSSGICPLSVRRAYSYQAHPEASLWRCCSQAQLANRLCPPVGPVACLIQRRSSFS